MQRNACYGMHTNTMKLTSGYPVDPEEWAASPRDIRAERRQKLREIRETAIDIFLILLTTCAGIVVLTATWKALGLMGVL